MVSMRIEGGKELAAALNSLSARVRRNTLVDALEQGAEPIRVLIRRFAPHEPGPPDIKDHIVVSRYSKTVGDDGFLARQDEFQATVAVGPEKGFFYGLFQEYGTSGPRGHAAQPFMRPGFDGGVQMSIPIVGKALWLAISERQLFRPGSFAG